MKKYTLLFILLAVPVLLNAGSAKSGFAVDAFAGYTSVSLQDVNNDMSNYYNPMSQPGLKQSTFGSALIAGGGVYFQYDWLFIGPRVEAILPADYTVSYTQSYSGHDISDKITFGTSLVPVMAGFKAVFGDEFYFEISEFFGYGFASASYKSDYKDNGIPDPMSISLGGGCEVAETNIAFHGEFSKSLKAGLNLGYRRANVYKMTVKQSSGSSMVPGDTWNDTYGNPIKFSYNGYILSGEVIYSF